MAALVRRDDDRLEFAELRAHLIYSLGYAGHFAHAIMGADGR